MSSTNDNGCPIDWGVFDYGLGWVLIVGTIVSYLPQHVKIWQMRSHEGLSFMAFGIGNIVAFTSLSNYMALEYKGTFWCCGEGVALLDCTGAYLAFLQLVLIYICQHVIILLYVIYYDHEFAHKNEKIAGTDYRSTLKWCLVTAVFEAVTSGALVLLFIFYGVDSDIVYGYGIGMMGLCGVLSCVQLLPQIIETFKMKQVGSLSIPTVAIQAVGCALTCINLAPHGSWEIWTPYAVQTVIGTFLTCEAIYYWGLERYKTKSINMMDDNTMYKKLESPVVNDKSVGDEDGSVIPTSM